MADGERTRLARTNRGVRSAAFAYCLLPIGLYLAEQHAGAAAWTLAVLLFAIYPQLAYWRAIRSATPSVYREWRSVRAVRQPGDSRNKESAQAPVTYYRALRAGAIHRHCQVLQ